MVHVVGKEQCVIFKTSKPIIPLVIPVKHLQPGSTKRNGPVLFVSFSAHCGQVGVVAVLQDG
jgi:hypothetical protein